jgi:hypothetical protein
MVSCYFCFSLYSFLWFNLIFEGPGWLNELGSCITVQLIQAYHHCCCEFESRSGRGVQHYVIKFVSDLWQIGGFLRVFRCPPHI